MSVKLEFHDADTDILARKDVSVSGESASNIRVGVGVRFGFVEC